jgi:tRNA(Ile)-lysidine synthase
MAPLQEWQGSLDRVRSADVWQALFDGEADREGIRVRNYSRGDRLQPLGMHGHKKVHDVFVDAKVPFSRRLTWPVVIIGSEIAWVPGCVRGETAKITAVTRWVCQVRVIPLPEK